MVTIPTDAIWWQQLYLNRLTNNDILPWENKLYNYVYATVLEQKGLYNNVEMLVIFTDIVVGHYLYTASSIA